MESVLTSITAEYQRYKALAEGAIGQITDVQVSQTLTGDGNSIAVLMWHLAGNLTSRFTDFLTSDGEKPWRDRDSEFLPRHVTRAELMQKWEHGWNTLFHVLDTLTDDQLAQSVVIRGRSLRVHRALHRSLAHASYHVGQIVYIARALRGPSWRFLSIPPGRSAEYAKDPTLEEMPNRPWDRR